MALTQLKTAAIADDAVTTDKLANAINTARDANTAKTTNATHTGDVTGATGLTIADNAVTLAKMAGGTDGQIITYDASGDPVAVGPGTDGQVLTSTGAGSPPAFEAIPAGVGGATGVDFNDSVKVRLGTGNDLEIYHDGSNSYIDSATANFYIRDGTTERVRINGYGTAITGGLLFGTDTAAANRLDDYEEGTWTPNAEGTSGNGTASYNARYGTYTKVGDLVHLTALAEWSSGDAGGDLRITNFPFSPQSNCEGIGNVMFKNVAIGGDCKNIAVYIGPNATACSFYQSRSNQDWDAIDYDDNGELIINITFRAN